MFLKVDSVTHLREYELRIEFNNGIVKDVELGCELYGELEPLRDPRLFAGVRVNPETGTIEWANGADFSPEFLFDVGESVRPAA